MGLVNFLFYKVCVVCVLVNFVLVLSQKDVGVQTGPELAAGTDSPEAASDLVCQSCNCSEPGLVDCTGRDLRTFFDIHDWDGLKSFSPTTVDLSQNPLTTVSRISSLPIQHLNLSHCEITAIEDGSFVYLAELVSVDLSHNKITTTALSRRVFGGVLSPGAGLLPHSKLRVLSLAHNDIHSLPADVFSWLPGVTRLHLSGNQLAYIDQLTMAAITDLVNLRELYLDDCELECLPEGLFRRQKRLQRLDLSSNRFTEVPSVLNEAKNLLYLNFGKNPLQVLPTQNAIRNLTKLQELRITRCSRLHTIEKEALGGLRQLVSLHVTHNPRLSALHADTLLYVDEDGLERWPALTELYLNSNNLSGLEAGLVLRWDRLARLDLSSNPYACDCTNRWLVDVLTPLLTRMGDHNRDNMICMKPAELRGISLPALHASNRTLPCPDHEMLMELPVPDLAILLGIMIGIFVTFPIVLVLVLLWRKGYFARCRNTNDEESDEETDAF